MSKLIAQPKELIVEGYELVGINEGISKRKRKFIVKYLINNEMKVFYNEGSIGIHDTISLRNFEILNIILKFSDGSVSEWTFNGKDQKLKAWAIIKKQLGRIRDSQSNKNDQTTENKAENRSKEYNCGYKNISISLISLNHTSTFAAVKVSKVKFNETGNVEITIRNRDVNGQKVNPFFREEVTLSTDAYNITWLSYENGVAQYNKTDLGQEDAINKLKTLLGHNTHHSKSHTRSGAVVDDDYYDECGMQYGFGFYGHRNKTHSRKKKIMFIEGYVGKNGEWEYTGDEDEAKEEA